MSKLLGSFGEGGRGNWEVVRMQGAGLLPCC